MTAQPTRCTPSHSLHYLLPHLPHILSIMSYKGALLPALPIAIPTSTRPLAPSPRSLHSRMRSPAFNGPPPVLGASRPPRPIINTFDPDGRPYSPTSTTSDDSHYSTRNPPRRVPQDDFTGPRSDSPAAYQLGMNMTTSVSAVTQDTEDGARTGWAFERESSSEGRLSPEGEDDIRSVSPVSRHKVGAKDSNNKRFTIPSTYRPIDEYSSAGLGMSEKGRDFRGGEASGWEKEGSKRKLNKRMIYCLIILLVIIAIVLGVVLGINARNHRRSRNNTSQTTTLPDTLLTDSSVHRPSSTSSSSLPPILSTPLPSVTSSNILVPTTPAQLPSFSINLPLPPSPTSYSTHYHYALHHATTTVPLTYTIPTAPALLKTRYNGDLQFTEVVVLPDMQGGEISSSLRFRVKPPKSRATSGVGSALGKKKGIIKMRKKVY